jgi:hypothetical protein
MGGEGSGRKPDIVRKILNEIRTPIAKSGNEGLFIPNYSGLKDEARKTNTSTLATLPINLTSGVTGTLPVANGGTGLTTLTANYIPYGNGANALSSSSSLTFNGTTLSVGASGASAQGLTINGAADSGGALTINSNGGYGLVVQYGLDGSDWFTVGKAGSGVVNFNAQGGYTQCGGAAAMGARMNIGQLSDSAAALALSYHATTSTNNVLEVNNDNADRGGNVFRINSSRNTQIPADESSGKYRLQIGAGQDLELYHDGTNSYIKNSTGNLNLSDSSSDVLTISSSKVGIKDTSPSYELDVTGEINATTAYRANGTQGLSGTYNFHTSEVNQVAQMVFTGGILTAVTLSA